MKLGASLRICALLLSLDLCSADTNGLLPKWPHGAKEPINPDPDAQESGRIIVNMSNGPVEGVLRGRGKNQTVAWWGIPFANPPTGDLRLKSPQPLTRTWTAPLQTTKVPNSCVDNEDCLYLNVYAPQAAIPVGEPSNVTQGLPVMFWIYGGGYVSGDNYQQGIYDGQNLAKHHNVIVVAVNYRLGNLGFMALDALRDEDKHGSTGNYGVQDQTLGLQWVKDNIAAFGGDPKRVTIFGESAGGFSVMWHLVSKASKGLFHGAIMESGTSQIAFFFQPYKSATKYHEETAEILNCPASLGAAAQLACLRKLPMKSILHGAGSELTAGKPKPPKPADHSSVYPIMPVGPVIDGTAMGTLDVPVRLVEAGNFNKVPLILGSNEDGGTLFEPMMPQVVPGARWPATIYHKTVGEAFDFMFMGNSTKFQSIYNVTEYKKGGASYPEDSLISRAIRDLIFMCPLRQIANAYAKHKLSAFMYVFHFRYGFLIDSILHLGDFHAGELPFVFKNWMWVVKAAAPLTDPTLMSDIMSCKWTTFAYTLDPNGGPNESSWPPGCQKINTKYSAWPSYSAKNREYYALKQDPEVRQIRADNVYPDDLFPRDPKCDVIDYLSADLQFQHENKTLNEDITIVV